MKKKLVKVLSVSLIAAALVPGAVAVTVSLPNETIVAKAAATGADIVKEATSDKYKDIKYEYGANSFKKKKFDCSAFTQYVFNQCGYSIGRSTSAQVEKGSKVAKAKLKKGDLVFFQKTDDAGVRVPSHVGIYIGNGKFIHCSSGKGKVVTTDLNSKYYKEHYYTARRIA